MEQEKFVSIITKNQGMIRRICKIYRDTPDDRKDLFQDIVLELWKSISTFHNEAKISTWIYRVALNTAIVRYRGKASKIQYQKIGEKELNLTAHPSDFEREQPIDFLYAAIDTWKIIATRRCRIYLGCRSPMLVLS